MELIHISLFTGTAGIDLAAEWAGFKTVLFVEIDPYCQKVLNKHWPNVPIIGDIRDVTKETLANTTQQSKREPEYQSDAKPDSGETRQILGNRGASGRRGRADRIPPVTLITGGFPCQPVSQAGKRRGKDDDRWLWPEMLRVISEVRPTWVVAENVDGLKSMVEYDSSFELEDKEYTEEEMAASYLSVGEIRERTGRGSLDEILESLEAIGYEVQTFILPACAVNAQHRRDRIFIVAYYKGSGLRPQLNKFTGKLLSKDRTPQELESSSRYVADTNGEHDVSRGYGAGEICGNRSESAIIPGGEPAASDTEGKGLERADAEGNSCAEGCPDEHRQGGRQADWWAVEPGLGRVAHGISHRVDRLRCLGNAVVPQQIYPILKAIAEIEKSIELS